MVVGLAPVAMIGFFWAKGGVGIHPALALFMLLLVSGGVVSLLHHNFYRKHRPRSALVPATLAKGLPVALLLFALGGYHLLATGVGAGITLSPGPRMESGQLVQNMVKVVTTAISPGLVRPPRVEGVKRLDLQGQAAWMRKPPFLGGGLWGALGYAMAFGLMGMAFGFLRKEVQDPREQHMAVGPLGVVTRGMVGLYFGSAMGFALGAALIASVRLLFPTVGPNTSEGILHFIYVFGAASHPNVAFSYGFATACLLAGALSLGGATRDMTAIASDPKAPELLRPLAMQIPEIVEPPAMALDMSRLQQESRNMILQVQSELTKLVDGPDWNFDRYATPPVGRSGAKPEPEATNLVSARLAEGEDEWSAMGSLGGVYVQIVAELGSLEIPAMDWLEMGEGTILELPRGKDAEVTVKVNGKVAGRGKPITIEGRKAVKMMALRGPIGALVEGG